MEHNRDTAFHNAIVAFQQNQYDQAVAWFKKALEAPFLGGANNNGLILNNIATVYNKCGRYNEAVEFYERAIENGLENDNILFSLAISYIHLGNNTRALSVYNFILDRNPNNGKAYYLRGKHLQRMGEYLKGSQDLGMAISLNYYG